MLRLSGYAPVVERPADPCAEDVSIKDRVALVRVEGPLIEAKSTIDELKGYVKDKSIKAIVLRVNSPGGGVVPSQEIFDEVKKAVAAKKVVVSMGSVAASAGIIFRLRPQKSLQIQVQSPARSA